MRYQKAIERITDVQNAEYHFDESIDYQLTSDDFEWLDTAKFALERLIPKKPKFYDTKFRQRGQRYGEHVTIERAYNCPYCNCTVWGTDKDGHCKHCGQALDWSETKGDQ